MGTDMDDDYSHNLESYRPCDNSMLFGCVDELLRDIALDEPRPVRLESPALGSFEGPLLPEEK